MKKLLLSLMAILAFSFQMNAQTLPFADDFEGFNVGDDIVQNTTYYDIGNSNSAIVTAATGDSDGQFVTVTPSDSVEHGMVLKVKPGPAFGGFPNGNYIFSVSVKAQNAMKVKLKLYGDTDHHTVTQEAADNCENWTTLEMKFNVFGLDDTISSMTAPVIYSYQMQELYIDNISIVDEATGLTVYKEDFSTVVSPNPSTGVFTIRSDKKIEEYSVINAAGQVVESASKLNTKNVNVDLSNAAKGLYLIKVKNVEGDSRVLKEVIK
jgi:hypothetical protein